MKIAEKHIVYSGENNPQFTSCSFPSLCLLKDGTLIASFKAAARKIPDNKTDNVGICVSKDMGKTWTDISRWFEPPIVDGKKTTLRMGYFIEESEDNLVAVLNAVDATLEDLPYYNEDTEGLKETYILVAHSKDSGKTWSELERVQVETFRDLPLPLTGAPFKTRDGKIGIQFEVNKHYYETEYWVHNSCAVYSSDGGYTWGDEVIITNNPDIYYWDQRVGVLDDGTISNIFWTFDRKKGDYINIHYTESHDNGKTFAPLIDTGLVGQPGNVISASDGSLVAPYINRDNAPIIKLAKSFDGGKNWEDVLTVFDFGQSTKGKQNAGMNDVWAEMGKFNVGHPYIIRLSDNKLGVYFYAGPSTHRTDFHLVIIEE